MRDPGVKDVVEISSVTHQTVAVSPCPGSQVAIVELHALANATKRPI
jgi:hypothetical protein